MASTLKPKSLVPQVTVGQFYTQHADALQLKLLAGAAGLQRIIKEGSVNRPGLALAGYHKYFAHNRVQVIGFSETSYLKSLSADLGRERIRALFKQSIPCIILARGIRPPKIIIEEAEAHEVAVFQSPLTTMRFINAATICLEIDFAPQATEHGSMVDIQGVGIMIRGKSGVGKSECVLSLLDRGHSLVADDITKIRCLEGRELIGTSSEITRFHMEVRGIGIINVANLFGVQGIRLEKRLDLVVTLAEWTPDLEVDRIGLDQDYYEILQIKIPHVTIPVRPGRDLATLVEVAAYDQKLRSMGQNSAMEFNERLLALMRNREK